ncbi:MAG: SLC26A/SulP transporter family protein [Saprospiraceae bacterium]|nr:SLC26A/SulP transporter family protein [Saprospiraceae bacterium]
MVKKSAANNKWAAIGKELQPSHLFMRGSLMPAIISGALIGLMTTILSISFAVLVFGKAMPEALTIGIGMALFSNMVFHLFAAFTSSGEGVISHVQGVTPPIQAAMVSSLMGILPLSMSMGDKTTVAVFALMLTTIFTGIVLFIAGWLKLGRLVRFLPMPVISGVLASVGFALVFGGMATMTNINVSLSSLPQLFSMAFILKWLPGIALAAALWLATARWKHALVFPAILALAILLFYLICFAKGLGISDLTAGKFLLGPFQYDQLWHHPSVYYKQVNAIDWSIFASQIGIIVTIPLVCFISGLLMLSAIEFSTGIDVKPNYELKAMGASNLMAGLMGGGFVGYPSATFTVMQYRLGSKTRLPGILSAIVPIIVLIAGASFLGYIPRFVIGGLLIYFGYQFIDHWVVKFVRHATPSDNTIIGAIVVTSLWLGFVASVGVGVLAAASFFLFKYSKISVIRYESTGASLRSRVTRNAMHDDWLSVNANRIAIFGLQGYIFFGTAHNLLEKIMSRVTDANQIALDAVVLDFRHVTGIDTSVVQSFHKLLQQLRQKNITLIFAQMPPKYQGLMQKIGQGTAATKGFAEFASLDEALEWREDNLLGNSDLPPYQSRTLLTVFTDYFKDKTKAETLLQYLNRMELLPGTKIIRQGEVAHDLFFIESGRISTYSEREGAAPIRLETMVDDTMVGEIGFYLGQLRTATVMADEPSIVYRLTKEALAQMETAHPVVAMELHRLIVQKTSKRVIHVYKTVKGFM